MEALKPVRLSVDDDGKVWTYDFGREFTGTLRFRTTGPAGTKIKLTILPPAGSEAVKPRVSEFTLAGTGTEEYRPRFYYNAISRVQVEGTAQPPTLGELEADHMQGWGLRDWVAIERTPTEIVNTPAYCLFATIVSRTAAMLGHEEDAVRYAKLAELIRAKFNENYLDPVTGIYGVKGGQCEMERWWDSTRPNDVHELWWSGDRPCTQAGQALPLALGLVPTDVRPSAESALLREIAAHRNHVSTGFVATPYLLQTLAELAPELGYAMVTSQDYPS